jgi:predicted small lipoprotein YifL
MNISRILIVLAALGLLAACGNKGPLVMPQKPVPVEQPAAPATPAPEEEGRDG